MLQAKTANDDAVTFENYDDTNYGYLRLIVDPKQLRIEYHPASDGVGAKTPDDSVTVDLATRRQTVYTPNDLGYPASARQVAERRVRNQPVRRGRKKPARRPRG